MLRYNKFHFAGQVLQIFGVEMGLVDAVRLTPDTLMSDYVKVTHKFLNRIYNNVVVCLCFSWLQSGIEKKPHWKTWLKAVADMSQKTKLHNTRHLGKSFFNNA